MARRMRSYLRSRPLPTLGGVAFGLAVAGVRIAGADGRSEVVERLVRVNRQRAR